MVYRPDESKDVRKMHTVYNLTALFVNLFDELQRHKKRPSRRMAERPYLFYLSFILRQAQDERIGGLTSLSPAGPH